MSNNDITKAGCPNAIASRVRPCGALEVLQACEPWEPGRKAAYWRGAAQLTTGEARVFCETKAIVCGTEEVTMRCVSWRAGG